MRRALMPEGLHGRNVNCLRYNQRMWAVEVATTYEQAPWYEFRKIRCCDMFPIATWRTAAKSWSAVSSLPPCSHISSGTGSHSKGIRPLVSWFAQQGQRWRDSISLIHRSDLCLRPLHKDKRIGRMATGWLRGVVSYRHTHVAGIHSLRPEYLLHLASVHDPDQVCCICGVHCQS